MNQLVYLVSINVTVVPASKVSLPGNFLTSMILSVHAVCVWLTAILGVQGHVLPSATLPVQMLMRLSHLVPKGYFASLPDALPIFGLSSQ